MVKLLDSLHAKLTSDFEMPPLKSLLLLLNEGEITSIQFSQTTIDQASLIHYLHLLIKCFFHSL